MVARKVNMLCHQVTRPALLPAEALWRATTASGLTLLARPANGMSTRFSDDGGLPTQDPLLAIGPFQRFTAGHALRSLAYSLVTKCQFGEMAICYGPVRRYTSLGAITQRFVDSPH